MSHGESKPGRAFESSGLQSCRSWLLLCSHLCGSWGSGGGCDHLPTPRHLPHTSHCTQHTRGAPAHCTPCASLLISEAFICQPGAAFAPDIELASGGVAVCLAARGNSRRAWSCRGWREWRSACKAAEKVCNRGPQERGVLSSRWRTGSPSGPWDQGLPRPATPSLLAASHGCLAWPLAPRGARRRLPRSALWSWRPGRRWGKSWECEWSLLFFEVFQ